MSSKETYFKSSEDASIANQVHEEIYLKDVSSQIENVIDMNDFESGSAGLTLLPVNTIFKGISNEIPLINLTDPVLSHDESIKISFTESIYVKMTENERTSYIEALKLLSIDDTDEERKLINDLFKTQYRDSDLSCCHCCCIL